MRYRRDPAELEPCFRRDVSDEQLLCATGKKALIGILVCLLSFVILIGLIIFILPSSKEVDGGDIDYVHRDIVPPYLSFTSEDTSFDGKDSSSRFRSNEKPQPSRVRPHDTWIKSSRNQAGSSFQSKDPPIIGSKRLQKNMDSGRAVSSEVMSTNFDMDRKALAEGMSEPTGSSSSAEQFAVEEDEPQNDCSLHKKISGVYNIAPNDAKPFPVYCQQETNGGGWTVIQRRIDGAVHFYNRTWLEYEQGFGVPGSSQWIGLENIYHLIASVKADWILRIELYGDYCTGAGCLKQENGYWWAEWPFKIGDASSLYALEIGTVIAGNLTGPDQPDLFQQNNGCPFSTIDNDNDHIDNVNCAQFRNYGFVVQLSFRKIKKNFEALYNKR
ncbi:unnamed protein product [Nippostrongylus brasiliensis]|uniref:Fibrinogen C-terminal domain-containing protein n=1 Tax=Nippostrongylus brasiliensis TaxID=27835 RepID=A0A0N4YBE4_NIPBR|nr:unnamed protein product [Nippostrongylus brasiliensis]